MKKIKVILSLIIISCIVMTVFSGCSAKSNSSNSSNGKVTLTFTYWGGTDEIRVINDMAKKFEASHPNINIKATNVPDSYTTKMNTLAASNDLPDVGYFPESSTIEWANKGMFLDLTDLYKKGEIPAKLNESIFKTKGGTVGSSVSNEIMVLYYNKAFFDKHNAEYPPADAANAWTWDKMLEVAKKLTVDKNGKHPDDPGFDPSNIVTYGVNIPTYDYGWIPMANSNGGGLTSPDGKQLWLNKPETVKAIQDIADLMNKYHVMPNPAQQKALPSNDDTQLMTNKVAMVVDGAWSMQVLGQSETQKGLKLGIGVLPKYKTPTTTNMGTPIVVFKATKHKAEALEFYKYIMNPENSIDLINCGLWMPNEKQWYEKNDLYKKWTKGNIFPKEYKTAVVDYAKNNTVQEPWYFLPGYQTIMQVVRPTLDKVWLGTQSAQDAINGIMPKVQPLYDQSAKDIVK